MDGRRRDSWIVMLLEDLREVARRDGLGASAEALGVAIRAVEAETAERVSAAETRAALSGDAGKHRH